MNGLKKEQSEKINDYVTDHLVPAIGKICFLKQVFLNMDTSALAGSPSSVYDIVSGLSSILDDVVISLCKYQDGFEGFIDD